MKTRREFLKDTACGSCLVIAGSSLALFTSSWTSAIDVDGDEFTIPLASFSDAPSVVVKHKTAGSIIVRKKDDGSFLALSLGCPHKGAKVEESGGEFKCPKHGSKFDLEGKVLKGPAKTDLKKYDASVQGDNLLVRVQ